MFSFINVNKYYVKKFKTLYFYLFYFNILNFILVALIFISIVTNLGILISISTIFIIIVLDYN